MKLVGGAAPTLPFSLETESAKSLQDRMTAGTLTSETLIKAYLARIALTNAEGPALQAVRVAEHATRSRRPRRSTASGRPSGARGPLHGIPVLLDDIDRRAAACRPPAGSIALQKSMPRG